MQGIFSRQPIEFIVAVGMTGGPESVKGQPVTVAGVFKKITVADNLRKLNARFSRPFS
jgi:hypothetical protein